MVKASHLEKKAKLKKVPVVISYFHIHQKIILWNLELVFKIKPTTPSKPLASAPFRTESDISVTAAKSTFDPAVFNCKATIKLIVLGMSMSSNIFISERIQHLQTFLDHQNSVSFPRILYHRYIYWLIWRYLDQTAKAGGKKRFMSETET